jgi:hypothetical protein
MHFPNALIVEAPGLTQSYRTFVVYPFSFSKVRTTHSDSDVRSALLKLALWSCITLWIAFIVFLRKAKAV